jgi:hypothetical protein
MEYLFYSSPFVQDRAEIKMARDMQVEISPDFFVVANIGKHARISQERRKEGSRPLSGSYNTTSIVAEHTV